MGDVDVAALRRLLDASGRINDLGVATDDDVEELARSVCDLAAQAVNAEEFADLIATLYLLLESSDPFEGFPTLMFAIATQACPAEMIRISEASN